MWPVWTLDEARAADRVAQDEGVPFQALLSAAGLQLARYVNRRVPKGPVVVLAGPGSNGGDGWVAARHLAQRRPVAVVPVLNPQFAGAEGWVKAATARGVRIVNGADGEESLKHAAVVVDAVFGTGFHGLVMESPAGPWLKRLEDLGTPVIAADMPSGIETNTGAYDGPQLNTLATVAMGAAKWGHVAYPGTAFIGDLVVADIGLSRRAFGDPPASFVEPGWAARHLPRVGRLAHKYDRGRVAVVGGSRAMPGAPVLSAWACLKAGAGLVEMVVPDSAGIGVSMPPALIRYRVPQTAGGSLTWSPELKKAIERADALVIGPGMGSGVEPRVLKELAALKIPAVLDADGIRAAKAADIALPPEWVMTPHAGELARFLDRDRGAVDSDRRQAVLDAAKAARGAVLLKGRFTVISDGGEIRINPTGTQVLATAGSGDVLSGIAARLLASGLRGIDALALAAFWHGWAGELGEEAQDLSLTADDLWHWIGPAARAIREERPVSRVLFWD